MSKSKHAMTSEVASQKKKLGHKREQSRLYQLGEGAEIIKGTGKSDIKLQDGLTESVKGGKKTQWALYTIKRIIDDNYFDEKEIDVIKDWIEFIPDDKNEWKINRQHYSINPNVDNLVQEFTDKPMKLIKYFCGVHQVDYLVTHDSRTNEWNQIPMIDFAQKIENNIKNVYSTKGGKLVISGGEKNVVLFELEIRKGNSAHKRILFHSLLHRIIDCMK
jgi:hypothetical protein